MFSHGGRMPEPYYITRSLIKITDPDKTLYDREVSYWAVSNDTFDSMDIDYSMMSDESLRKIKVNYLGEIEVEIDGTTN